MTVMGIIGFAIARGLFRLHQQEEKKEDKTNEVQSNPVIRKADRRETRIDKQMFLKAKCLTFVNEMNIRETVYSRP